MCTGIAGKYNHGSGFTYHAPEGTQFVNLKTLFQNSGEDESATYLLKGVYINSKSNYGPAPVAVIVGSYVNLPKHLLGTVTEMMGDSEFVTAVNDGHVAFSIRPYVRAGDSHANFTVTWLDV